MAYDTDPDDRQAMHAEFLAQAARDASGYTSAMALKDRATAIVPSLHDASAKFQQYRSENPLVDAIPGAVAGYTGGVMGPIGTASAAMMPSGAVGSPGRRPGLAAAGAAGESTPPAGTPPPGAPPAAPPAPGITPGVDVESLPKAAPPKMFMGTGVGGGAGSGEVGEKDLGTLKGIRGAQRDLEAEQGGVIAKRGEEYEGRMDALKVEAENFATAAEAKRIQVEAEKSVVEATQKEQEEHEAGTQKAMDEVSKKGVDPGRLMKNKSVFQWIAMFIGAAAGGAIGSDKMMEGIRSEIKDDIDAQETDIKQGWKGVEGRKTAYEHMRVRGVDKLTANVRQYDKTLEAVELDLKAKLANATLPEQKAKLEGALQAMQAERAGNQVQIQEYWKGIADKRASAAAAAASAQYARNRQFMKDQQEWELHKSQIVKNLGEGGKASAEGKAVAKEEKETAGKVEEYAKRLGPLAEDEAAIRDLKMKLLDKDGNIDTKRGIPGVGPGADLRANIPVGGVSGAVVRGTGLGIAALSEEELTNRVNWDRLALSYKHMVTGAGGSDKEADLIDKAFRGANTPGEQANAIKQADFLLASKKATIGAGYSQKVRDTHAQNAAEVKAEGDVAKGNRVVAQIPGAVKATK
jgi:hypothetical protein